MPYLTKCAFVDATPTADIWQDSLPFEYWKSTFERDVFEKIEVGKGKRIEIRANEFIFKKASVSLHDEAGERFAVAPANIIDAIRSGFVQSGPDASEKNGLSGFFCHVHVEYGLGKIL